MKIKFTVLPVDHKWEGMAFVLGVMVLWLVGMFLLAESITFGD